MRIQKRFPIAMAAGAAAIALCALGGAPQAWAGSHSNENQFHHFSPFSFGDKHGADFLDKSFDKRDDKKDRKFPFNLSGLNHSSKTYCDPAPDPQPRLPGDPSSVPEPSTLALFGIGLIGIAALLRRKMS